MRHGRSSSARGGACAPSFPAERVGDGPAAFQDRPARMRACKVRSRASPFRVFLLTGLLIGGMLTLSGSRGSALQPPDEGWTGNGQPTPGTSPQRPATRLKVEAKGGIFLVYDAAAPRDSPRPHPPYLAYWNDFESEYIFVYGRPLWTLPDVGHALLSLQRDLRIEAAPMAEAGPILDTAITAALAEPEEPTPWHYAGYRFIQELMGLDPGADVDSSPITLGEALASPPSCCDSVDDPCCPCCPMAEITPTVKHIPGPPPWASAPWLIDRGIGIVASCCEDGGGGGGGGGGGTVRCPGGCSDGNPCTSDWCEQNPSGGGQCAYQPIDPPDECCIQGHCCYGPPDGCNNECCEPDEACCQGVCGATGACCVLTAGSCTVTTQQCCATAGGVYLGAGTTCTPFPELCRPVCENCHTVNLTFNECRHTTSNPAEPCSLWQCTHNVMATASCDFFPHRLGARNCNTFDTGVDGQVLQWGYDLPIPMICETSNPGDFHEWTITYSGCGTVCQGTLHTVRCDTNSCPGPDPPVRLTQRGRVRTCGCP